MTIAIYNCIWTPLTISFDWAVDQEENNDYLKVIDFVILGIYTCDIIIQFLTSYYNVTTGDEIKKPSMIMRRYMLSIEFLVDFLSTFPFRWISINSGYDAFASLVQLLKVLRIRKLYSTISKADLTIEAKALTKIAFFSFLLCIYTHITGCVMWFFLKEDYLWVAPTDFGNIRSRLQDPWYQTESPDANFRQVGEMREDFDIFMFQWMSMWYHSALTLMLVEVTGRSLPQLFVLIVVYIINAIFNAILFGIYFDLLVQARERENEFLGQLDNANSAM